MDVRPRNQFDIANIPGGRPSAFPSFLPLRLRLVQLVLKWVLPSPLKPRTSQPHH